MGNLSRSLCPCLPLPGDRASWCQCFPPRSAPTTPASFLFTSEQSPVAHDLVPATFFKLVSEDTSPRTYFPAAVGCESLMCPEPSCHWAFAQQALFLLAQVLPQIPLQNPLLHPVIVSTSPPWNQSRFPHEPSPALPGQWLRLPHTMFPQCWARCPPMDGLTQRHGTRAPALCLPETGRESPPQNQSDRCGKGQCGSHSGIPRTG